MGGSRGGNLPPASTSEEDIMTDYQLKSILKMVLKIIESSNDLEDAVKSIKELIEES